MRSPASKATVWTWKWPDRASSSCASHEEYSVRSRCWTWCWLVISRGCGLRDGRRVAIEEFQLESFNSKTSIWKLQTSETIWKNPENTQGTHWKAATDLPLRHQMNLIVFARPATGKPRRRIIVRDNSSESRRQNSAECQAFERRAITVYTVDGQRTDSSGQQRTWTTNNIADNWIVTHG